jgi:hypothetical protein
MEDWFLHVGSSGWQVGETVVKEAICMPKEIKSMNIAFANADTMIHHAGLLVFVGILTKTNICFLAVMTMNFPQGS